MVMEDFCGCIVLQQKVVLYACYRSLYSLAQIKNEWSWTNELFCCFSDLWWRLQVPAQLCRRGRHWETSWWVGMMGESGGAVEKLWDICSIERNDLAPFGALNWFWYGTFNVHVLGVKTRLSLQITSRSDHGSLIWCCKRFSCCWRRPPRRWERSGARCPVCVGFGSGWSRLCCPQY